MLAPKKEKETCDYWSIKAVLNLEETMFAGYFDHRGCCCIADVRVSLAGGNLYVTTLQLITSRPVPWGGRSKGVRWRPSDAQSCY